MPNNIITKNWIRAIVLLCLLSFPPTLLSQSSVPGTPTVQNGVTQSTVVTQGPVYPQVQVYSQPPAYPQVQRYQQVQNYPHMASWRSSSGATWFRGGGFEDSPQSSLTRGQANGVAPSKALQRCLEKRMNSLKNLLTSRIRSLT